MPAKKKKEESLDVLLRKVFKHEDFQAALYLLLKTTKTIQKEFKRGLRYGEKLKKASTAPKN